MRSPTGSKAKGTGEVDLAMQRDKLVLSHLLKTIVQEENPTLNVAPNKKTKSSSSKLFWGKVTLPGALGRRKERMRGAYIGAAEERCLSRLRQRHHSGLTAGCTGTSSSSFCKC